MSKKVLIISTSLRQNSNSDILADKFMKGALDKGHEVEKISLKDKNIQFCKGCLVCQDTQKCVINDDAVKIAEKMKDVDVVVWATPVYYYDMSGQMKTLIDRLNPLFPTDYKFRDIYLLASAAEPEESAVDGTLTGLKGWIECFEKTSLKGVVRAVGVTNPKDIELHKNYLKQAYSLGQNI